MRIIIKFVLKNIYEKKLRTFLILFSILLSSALFFASQAVTDNVAKMFLADARQFYGSADLMIYPEKGSPSSALKVSQLGSFVQRTDVVVGALQGSAYYKNSRTHDVASINLRGTTIEDMDRMNPFYTDDNSKIGSFTGRKIILSKKAAEKFGFQTGDSIRLEIRGTSYRFTICALAHPEGFFAETGQTVNALVPRTALSSIYGAKDISNVIFIKLKEGVDLTQSREELEKIYKKYGVREPVPEADLKKDLESMSVGFTMMTLVVAFMSIFIIYTSFKVITLERLPMIGTFRSIGATRRTTNLVMLSESLVYGILGGLIGCGLGFGVLYLIVMFITPSYMAGYDIQLSYTSTQLLSAFLIAVVISLASSVIPIIKTSKIPVKDIVLNSIEKKRKSKLPRYLFGAVLILLFILLPIISPKELSMIFDSFSMLASLCGILLLLPLITSGFVLLFEKIYILLFGNIGAIAAKNLRENKSVMNNIALLSIAISSLLMITTISNSVLVEVTNFYTRNADFDIYVATSDSGRSFEQSLSAVEGVDDICGNFSTYGVDVVGKNSKLSLYGVNTGKFSDFFKLSMDGDKKAALRALNNDRSVIASIALKDKLGLKLGDTITMKMPKGNITYRISAFQTTLLENGSLLIMAEKYYKADMGVQNYTEIYVKSKEPVKAEAAIKKKFARNLPFIMTLDDMAKENYETNSSIFGAMEAFAYLTLIIGIFGIINNYLISFIERRRSLAMYRSVGMSKRQIVRMMFVEAVTGGLIGAIMGLVAGLMMIYTVPYVMKALDFPMAIILNPTTFALSFLMGLMITLIASISPTVKTSKLHLITALKYE